jgi:hypothetical protein
VYLCFPEPRKRDSSVGIAANYGLDGQNLIPGKGKRFLCFLQHQNGFGAHSASYPMGTWGCFPGIKLGREADYSAPSSSSAEVKNGAILPSPTRFYGMFSFYVFLLSYLRLYSYVFCDSSLKYTRTDFLNTPSSTSSTAMLRLDAVLAVQMTKHR